MAEIVPFQEKRRKIIKTGISPNVAIYEEFMRYYRKNLGEVLKKLPDTDSSNIITTTDRKTLYASNGTAAPSLLELVRIFAPVTSPRLIGDPTLPWTLSRLDAPLVALLEIQKYTTGSETISPLEFLPKPYRKMIAKVYTSQSIVDALATFLESKRAAAKYMRILQKRFGIYKKKKPPFSKKLLIANS